MRPPMAFSPALRRALARYAPLPGPDRFHVRARAFSCPMDAIAAHVPAGAVLDLGCGHGLLALLLAELGGRTVKGIDVDARKIALAREVAPAGVSFAATGLEREPAEAYDAVAVLDVLYLVPRGEWEPLLRACRERLRPGGRLLVKETGRRPRWKLAKAWLQEQVMVRLLRRTQGSSIGYASREELEELLTRCGFAQVTSLDVSRGYTTPHVVVLGTRD